MHTRRYLFRRNLHVDCFRAYQSKLILRRSWKARCHAKDLIYMIIESIELGCILVSMDGMSEYREHTLVN